MKNEFSEARETMAAALKADPGLQEAYASNVAMLLADHYNGAAFLDKPTRDRAAGHILHLVFRSPEPFPG